MSLSAISAALADPRASLAALSFALSICAFLPYIHDTLRRRTQPHRASWLIWSMLSSIAFASSLQGGAGLSLWFIGAQMVPTILIFLLSIPLGEGDYFSPRNRVIFICAGLGLVAWALFDAPALALAMIITISALGAIPTVIKAARAPNSETPLTWALCALSAGCALFTADGTNLMELAYPTYLFALYLVILAAIAKGRTRTAHITKLTF